MHWDDKNGVYLSLPSGNHTGDSNVKPLFKSKTIWINLAVVLLTAALQWAKSLPTDVSVDDPTEPTVAKTTREEAIPEFPQIALLAIGGVAATNICLRSLASGPARW